MKKIFTSALILIQFASIAQITIIQADFPTAGQGYINANDQNYTTPIPAGGPAQSWNYASLLNVTQDTTAFVTASSTPYAALFANANLAIQTAGGQQYGYFISGASGFKIKGFYDVGTGLAAVFNPTQMLIPAPFTYNNSYNGISRLQIDTNLSGINTRIVQYSSITILADGYGSLILPTQTISNTLRIKTTTVSTDSIYVNLGFGWIPMPGNTPTVSQTINYQWLQNGNGGVVLDIQADSLGTTSTSSAYLLQYGLVGIENHSPKAEIKIYPNPATDFLTIESPEAFDLNTSLFLYSSTGQMTENYSMNGLTEFVMQTAHLTNGVYNFRIVNADKTVQTGRFIVNH